MDKEIKTLFPDNIETITISKNDYDRLFGEITYKNIILQQRIDKAVESIEDCKKVNGDEKTCIIDYNYLLNILKGDSDGSNK